MRINIYAEELPDELGSRAVTCVSKITSDGQIYFGARLYLRSPLALHDTPDDDDRSAVTIWGPRPRVAALLRALAEQMDPDR